MGRKRVERVMSPWAGLVAPWKRISQGVGVDLLVGSRKWLQCLQLGTFSLGVVNECGLRSKKVV